MRLTALIFDLDGVIADTSDLHFQSWLQVTPEYGLLVDHALNDRLRSRSRRASLEIILAENGRELSESACEDLMARKNQVYLQLLQGMDASALLPGVVPLIEEASAAGLRLAVGSASRNAEAVLRRTGIRDRFDLVVDGNRDLPSKPAPAGNARHACTRARRRIHKCDEPRQRVALHLRIRVEQQHVPRRFRRRQPRIVRQSYVSAAHQLAARGLKSQGAQRQVVATRKPQVVG